MKTYAIGDVHGALKALKQVIEKAPLKDGDKIIFLGDYVDGWIDVYEVIDYILSLKDKYNIICIKGNHDEWFNEFIRTGLHGSGWKQGAEATRQSYIENCDLAISGTHEHFFATLMNYYIDDENRCFVHGGFNRHELINEQHYSYIYYWDRNLWMQAMSYKGITKGPGETELTFKIKNKFKEVFIGHTTTTNWGTEKPIRAANVWNLDTGAGWNGRLTIMDVDTKEYWQSDPVKELYPNDKGRT